MSSLRRFKRWYRGYTGRNISTSQAREIINRSQEFRPGFSLIDRVRHWFRYNVAPVLRRMFGGY